MSVGGSRAVAVGEGGTQGLGVLVAEVLPGKLFGPQAVAGEEVGHGLQGSLLGPARPRGQAGEIDGHGVPGRVADGCWQKVFGDGWKGFGHRHGLVRIVILISSLPDPQASSIKAMMGP